MNLRRRNFFIRSISAVAGDGAIGLAVASACVWIIQSAALGLFLSFLLWMLAIIVSLALSQHLLHPALGILLSDRKLDRSLATAADALRTGAEAAHELWGYVRRHGIEIRSVIKTA